MRKSVASTLLILLLVGSGWALWMFLEGPASDEVPGAGQARGASAGAPTLQARDAAASSQAAGDNTPDPTRDGFAADFVGRKEISLTVLDWEGRPAHGALVEIRPQGAGFTSATTDERGQVSFPGVDPSRTCDLKVYPHFVVGARSWHDPVWMPRDATLELGRALTITGRVLDEDGQPAEDFRIQYRLADSGDVHSVLQHSAGSFTIGDLAPGVVTLWAHHELVRPRLLTGPPPYAAPPREVEAGSQDIEVQVVRGGLLHLRFPDDEGDFGVQLVAEGPVAPEPRLVSERTGRVVHGALDLTGHAIFSGLPREGPWRLLVIGLHNGRYADMTGLQPDARVQVVKTRAGAVVRGTLVLPPELSAARVVVWVENPDLGRAQGHVDTSSGTFEISGLPPARSWVVHAAGLARGAFGGPATHRAEAPARTGEHVELLLEP